MPDSVHFKKKYAFYTFSANSKCVSRAVIKSRGQGFCPAIMNGAPSFFHRKIEEKRNQKKSLAVWFPAYVLYLPSNMKS